MSATEVQVAALAQPTPDDEVKQRPIFNKAKVKVGELDYIDARFVMERLDDMLGPTNWQTKFREVTGGIVCSLGILISREGTDLTGSPAGEWVWKEDVGTESTIEGTKGSYSDALKRAAVHWGIARDLYDAREGDRHEAPQRESAQTYQPSQQAAPQRASGGGNKPVDVDPNDSPWVCPEHGSVVAFPAGVSAAGRKYDAFYACPTGRDCPHRAPRGLRVKPEHLLAPVEGEDDLPF